MTRIERRSPNELGAILLTAMLTALLGSCVTPFIEVESPDFSRLADGSYQGSYKASMGSASVIVAISGGRLDSVQLTAFDSSPIGAPATAVRDRVLSAQSLDVDTVSGSTYSSRVILRAIQDALDKAVKP